MVIATGRVSGVIDFEPRKRRYAITRWSEHHFIPRKARTRMTSRKDLEHGSAPSNVIARFP